MPMSMPMPIPLPCTEYLNSLSSLTRIRWVAISYHTMSAYAHRIRPSIINLISILVSWCLGVLEEWADTRLLENSQPKPSSADSTGPWTPGGPVGLGGPGAPGRCSDPVVQWSSAGGTKCLRKANVLIKSALGQWRWQESNGCAR